MKPCSSIHSLSYHGNCHPVCEVIGGIPCVCTIGLGGSHLMLGGSTLVSLCWSTEKTLDFSSPIFDRGNHYVLLGMLLIVMSWWCIIDSVLFGSPLLIMLMVWLLVFSHYNWLL
jgi:hypothetical protein